MPTFNYTAIDNEGNRVANTLQAKNKFDLATQLKHEGIILVSVKDEGEKKVNLMAIINALIARVKIREKIVFAHNLGAMIDAGLSLSRALSILERQTKNEKFKQTIKKIAEHVQSGGTLNSGLAEFPKIFTPLFVSMVKAGEESGGLGDSLKTVGVQMDKIYKLQKKVKGAMVYPTIIIIAMTIVGVLMLMFVVPTLTDTFEEIGVDLPFATRIIIGLSDFLSNYIFVALGALVGFILGMSALFRTNRGKRVLHFIMLRIPLVGELIRKTNSARTTRTLSALLSSGVDMVEALSITQDVIQNVYYKDIIEEAKKGIQKGSPLSSIFSQDEHLYPILVGEMMEVGEETGKMTDMLLEISKFYENEVEETTKNLSTIVEPILMVIVGVGVGFFAISMITPIYSVLENI